MADRCVIRPFVCEHFGGNYKAAIFGVVLICMSYELEDEKALTNLGLIKMGIHQKNDENKPPYKLATCPHHK